MLGVGVERVQPCTSMCRVPEVLSEANECCIDASIVQPTRGRCDGRGAIDRGALFHRVPIREKELRAVMTCEAAKCTLSHVCLYACTYMLLAAPRHAHLHAATLVRQERFGKSQWPRRIYGRHYVEPPAKYRARRPLYVVATYM
jgi:hypothetical protein